ETEIAEIVLAGAVIEYPGDLEIRDIALVDLGQRRVVLVIRAAAVRRPLADGDPELHAIDALGLVLGRLTTACGQRYQNEGAERMSESRGRRTSHPSTCLHAHSPPEGRA